MPIALYCPSNGPDLGPLARSFIQDFANCDQTIHWGGANDLGTLNVNTRLYLLAHAHYEYSKFEDDNQKYTAEEMAELLVGDGLPVGLKHLELLTCKAGASTVTTVLMAKFRDLANKAARAQAQNDQKKLGKLLADFDKLKAKLPEASDYQSDDQVLPLGAQLAQALGNLNRKALIITCYKAPISYLFAGGEVNLIVPLGPDEVPGPRRAAQYPDLKTTWRCA